MRSVNLSLKTYVFFFGGGGCVARCWSVWLVIPFSKGAYER